MYIKLILHYSVILFILSISTMKAREWTETKVRELLVQKVWVTFEWHVYSDLMMVELLQYLIHLLGVLVIFIWAGQIFSGCLDFLETGWIVWILLYFAIVCFLSCFFISLSANLSGKFDTNFLPFMFIFCVCVLCVTLFFVTVSISVCWTLPQNYYFQQIKVLFKFDLLLSQQNISSAYTTTSLLPWSPILCLHILVMHSIHAMSIKWNDIIPWFTHIFKLSHSSLSYLVKRRRELSSCTFYGFPQLSII